MARILALASLCTAIVASQVCAQGVPSVGLRLEAPRQWVAGKTLTLKAELVTPDGHIDWETWGTDGLVTVTRASNGAVIPTSTIVFDTHDGTPAADTIQFLNGMGSVSIKLDSAGISAGELVITVLVNGVSASRTVDLLPANTPMRTVAGSLPDSDLNWGPSQGVIHITGTVWVPVGKLLTIQPGTMIMVDPGPANDGTRIIVYGRVEARGTADKPIFFFPSTGAPGLHFTALCTEPVYNVNAWRGIVHMNQGPSGYAHCFVTGAGNAPVAGHRRPPVFNFSHTHSMKIEDCVFADNNGKAIYGTGAAGTTYEVRRTLVTHCGHGAEFTVSGGYSLTVEDCYFLDNGFAPEACDRNGDHLNIRADIPGNGGPKTVRRCVFAEGGDECIDHKGTHIIVEDCIMRGATQSGISLEPYTGGSLTISDSLLFDNGTTAVAGSTIPIYATNITAVGGATWHNLYADQTVVRGSVFSGSRWTTCYGTVTGCNLPPNSPVACVAGNTFLPAGLDAVNHIFEVSPLSPLFTANSDGSPLGWTRDRFDAPRAEAIPVPLAMVFNVATSVPGLGSVANEDVVVYDSVTGEWSRLIDGSDLGLAPLAIDAFAVLPDAGFLLSFATDADVPGLIGGPDGTLVDDADIVRFIPSSLGADTAGTLTFYFDGSDVGLAAGNSAHDIDALAVEPGGALLISTLGSCSVLGATSLDEDVLRFRPDSLGRDTAGTWSLALRGAGMGLSDTADEDLDGLAVAPDSSVLFSTLGAFNAAGAAGTGLDIGRFVPTAVGESTAGISTTYLTPVAAGIDSTHLLSAIEIMPDWDGSWSMPLLRAAAPPCRADVNGDGVLDDRDLADFLDGYFGGPVPGQDDSPRPTVEEFLQTLMSGCD